MISANELAQLVAFREGKKESLPIGQIKEVLGIVADLLQSEPGVLACLVKLGLSRRRALLRRVARSSRVKR